MSNKKLNSIHSIIKWNFNSMYFNDKILKVNALKKRKFHKQNWNRGKWAFHQFNSIYLIMEYLIASSKWNQRK